MRTNIDLDDSLVDQAFHYAPAKTKKDLIHLALQEYVENHRRKDVRELRGRVEFAQDYDYKALRSGIAES